jgi:hypothetical protein
MATDQRVAGNIDSNLQQVKPRLVCSGDDLVEQLYLSELKFGE